MTFLTILGAIAVWLIFLLLVGAVIGEEAALVLFLLPIGLGFLAAAAAAVRFGWNLFA